MPRQVESAVITSDASSSEAADREFLDRWLAAFEPFIGDAANPLHRGAYTIVRSEASTREPATEVVVAHRILHEQSDYRGALQRWFAQVRSGGWLILTVPEGGTANVDGAPIYAQAYDRDRLLEVIEESLGVDQSRVEIFEASATAENAEMAAGTDLLAVVQKHRAARARPRADADELKGPHDFRRRRTRVEVARTQKVERILVLKLDHLGDFIMGLPALRRMRNTFRDAHLTLVVGSWNEKLAREAAVADELILFDAFPRNSSEADVNLPGRVKSFARAVSGSYDLAIDLRTDGDTRFFLQHVDAARRAGLGTRAQYPFLDIFLPIDSTRHEHETAREDVIEHWPFACQPFCRRSRYRIHCAREDVTSRLGAVIWGPYLELRPGNYFFEPFLEFDEPHDGMLIVDVAFNYERNVAKAITATSNLSFEFRVEKPRTKFEFRIFEPDNYAPLGFSFYGGRLVREAAESVLHQSEYLSLLIELVAMRLQRHGLLIAAEASL